MTNTHEFDVGDEVKLEGGEKGEIARIRAGFPNKYDVDLGNGIRKTVTIDQIKELLRR